MNNEAKVFHTYIEGDSLSDGTNSNNKTPLPSRAPQSRMGNQEIDIDQLIAKLLEIPNEELLDSLLNLSPNYDEDQGRRSRMLSNELLED